MRKKKQSTGYGNEFPPLPTYVEIYFQQKNMSAEDAKKFFDYYDGKDWQVDNGKSIHSWKQEANNWIWNRQKNSRFRNRI